jgi:hypothetical protein
MMKQRNERTNETSRKRKPWTENKTKREMSLWLVGSNSALTDIGKSISCLHPGLIYLPVGIAPLK